MPRTAEAGTRRVGGVGSATRAAGARHVSTQGRIPWAEFLRFRAETLDDDDDHDDDDDDDDDEDNECGTRIVESACLVASAHERFVSFANAFSSCKPRSCIAHRLPANQPTHQPTP